MTAVADSPNRISHTRAGSWAGRLPVRLVWTAVLVAAALQAWAGLRRPLVDRLSDLQVYLGSVRQLWGDGELYDFAAAATGAPFTYPPFAALVLSPFAVPPFAVVATVWSVATIAVVIALSRVVVRRTVPGPDVGLRTGLVCLALFLSVPVSSNLRFGQISIFLVALVLLDALKLVPERFQGVATGIAGAIKLTPLIFVPYFWLCGRRRTAVTAAFTFAASTALAWAVLPGESRRFWFTEIFNVNRVGNIATGGNQSLNGALLRADLPDTARTVVVALLGGAVVLVALWRGVRAYRNDDLLAGAVMIGAAGLVLSPVSWTHHQVWLVLAAFVAVSTRPVRNLWWAAAVLVIMVLPVISIGVNSPIGPLTGNARGWLAIAVAALVPFVAVRRRPSPEQTTASGPGEQATASARPGKSSAPDPGEPPAGGRVPAR